MTDRDPQNDDHLPPELIARYLDPTLQVDDQGRIEAHLAKCDFCRGEVLATRELVQGRAHDRRWLLTIPVAAAAAVLLLVVIPRSVESPGVDGAQRSGGESGQQVQVVAPVNDSAITESVIRFVWRNVGAVAQYSLKVTNTAGDVLMSETTTDTVLEMAVTAEHHAGQTFFWYVDALFGDGESATTGIRRFNIPP